MNKTFSKPGLALWFLLSSPALLAQTPSVEALTPSSDTSEAIAPEQSVSPSVAEEVALEKAVPGEAAAEQAVSKQAASELAPSEAPATQVVASDQAVTEPSSLEQTPSLQSSEVVSAEAALQSQQDTTAAAAEAAPVAARLSGQALVDQQAAYLLQAMSVAVRGMNYRGMISYEHGETTDTLKIAHRVENGVELERIQHMSGLDAEYLARGRSLDCVAVGDKILRGAGLRLGAKLLRLADLYQFRIPGLQRVAGRPALVLQARARDKFRFGYNIAIDRETGFPLMTEVVGARQKIMERFQFVEIDLAASIDADELQAHEDHAVNIETETCQAGGQTIAQTWEAAWLPTGFVYIGQSKAKSGCDLLSFTDGLSSISVVIKPVLESQFIGGRAVVGATSIYISKLKLGDTLYSVSVLGEVPGIAVRDIGESIRPFSAQRPKPAQAKSAGS